MRAVLSINENQAHPWGKTHYNMVYNILLMWMENVINISESHALSYISAMAKTRLSTMFYHVVGIFLSMQPRINSIITWVVHQHV